jgi:2-methylisocitrate lyase-like PEP mutase family enzyme
MAAAPDPSVTADRAAELLRAREGLPRRRRTVVFVPALLSEEQVASLVDAFEPQRLTCIGIPGGPSLARLQELGVARVSYGPMPQRVALTALQELVEEIHRGGEVPPTTRTLS